MSRIIVTDVPDFRLNLDAEVQAHHAMIDLMYELEDPWLYEPEQVEDLGRRMDEMAEKRREVVALDRGR